MVAALTNESATSKSVYFAHCTSEMIFITHLLAEEPERLAGPLLADTYVTLLKGRNAWYGQKLAKGELTLEMGDSIKGKGMIQVLISITLNNGEVITNMSLFRIILELVGLRSWSRKRGEGVLNTYKCIEVCISLLLFNEIRGVTCKHDLNIMWSLRDPCLHW